MDPLIVLILVILVVVIVVLAGMQVTYSHDSLMSSANDVRSRIKSEREARYSIGKSILDGNGSADARWLSAGLDSYVSIRQERQEIAWEKVWLPRMRRYVKVHASAAAKRFQDNEACLANDRETLASIESDIARIEGSKTQMWLLNAVDVMSKRVPALAKAASDRKDAMLNRAKSTDDRLHEMQHAKQPPSHRYGNATYFKQSGAGDDGRVTNAVANDSASGKYGRTSRRQSRVRGGNGAWK